MLPAVPSWAEHICGTLEAEGRFQPLHGIGCEPVLVTATADEMLDWISSALKFCEIAFSEENGPIKWPKHTLFEALRQIPEKDCETSKLSYKQSRACTRSFKVPSVVQLIFKCV